MIADDAAAPADVEPSDHDRRRSDRSIALAELVVDIATAASGERDLDQILSAALDRLRGVVQLTGGSIALIDGDDLVIRAAVGPYADEAIGGRVPRGANRSWRIVETLQPFMSGDLRGEGIPVRTGDAAKTGLQSWLGVPIARHGVGIGLLEVDSIERDAFTAEDAELVATVARALAGPIDLAWRFVAERRAAELREAFVGMISHELRTPITTIYGTSLMLRRLDRTLTPEARAHALEDIEAEADRLRRLVEDLLVLSRAERGRVEVAREPMLIAHVLRRVIEAEAAHWPDHTLALRMPSTLPLVAGEETYVEQVIRNLVTNAAKYSPGGGEVVVEAKAEADERSRPEVVVRVLDSGIGFSGDEADRLFDLFYRSPTASRQAAGAGVGLFVCRELVEAMGGRIWATSRSPRGAEFAFALPVHDPVLEPD